MSLEITPQTPNFWEMFSITSFFPNLYINSKSSQCWKFLFARSSATGWLWAFSIMFFFIASLLTWDSFVRLIVVQNLFSACIHPPRGWTSFLPFTVDVSAAISRAHLKLSLLFSSLATGGLEIMFWDCRAFTGLLGDNEAIKETISNKNMIYFWTIERQL